MKQRHVICVLAMNLQERVKSNLKKFFSPGLFAEQRKTFAVQQLLDKPGFADIGVTGLEP